MNAGEYGIAHNLSVGYDMSGKTSLALNYVRPDKTTFTVTDPNVTLGASPLITSAGTFAANQYVTYTFRAGDIPVPGAYTARLIYNDATKRLISDQVTFTINP